MPEKITTLSWPLAWPYGSGASFSSRRFSAGLCFNECSLLCFSEISFNLYAHDRYSGYLHWEAMKMKIQLKYFYNLRKWNWTVRDLATLSISCPTPVYSSELQIDSIVRLATYNTFYRRQTLHPISHWKFVTTRLELVNLFAVRKCAYV